MDMSKFSSGGTSLRTVPHERSYDLGMKVTAKLIVWRIIFSVPNPCNPVI